MTDAVTSIIAATPEGSPPAKVDWKRVEEALATANGIPVAVGSRQTPGHPAETAPPDDRTAGR